MLPTNQDQVDFSSNDYLGFANDQLLQKRAEILFQTQTGIKNGASGSRLLSGNHPLYQELEKVLAEYHGYETALVFNSGYDANIGFFSAVPQRGDIIFYDELVHASIRDGIRMGSAKAYKFKHNDLNDLQDGIKRIKTHQDEYGEIYIVTESVFSMDGDSPDLLKLLMYCKKNRIYPIIDEAHAVGVFGKGLVHQIGLQHLVFASVITFGKALGCHGAAVLGSVSLKTYLINFSRSLIYTTALPPHTLATILMGYEHLQTEAGEAARQLLLSNIYYFNSRLNKLQLQNIFLKSDSAIQVAVLGDVKRVKECSKKLRSKGFDIRPILYPTVPEGKERLRICIHSFNTHGEMDQILKIIAESNHG